MDDIMDDILAKLKNDVDTLSPSELFLKHKMDRDALLGLIEHMEYSHSHPTETPKITISLVFSILKDNIIWVIVLLVLLASGVLWLLGKKEISGNLLTGFSLLILLYLGVNFVANKIKTLVHMQKGFNDLVKNMNLFEKSVEEMDAGNNQQAISNFRKLIETDRENPDYWFKLGQAIDNTGDYDEAISCYEISIGLPSVVGGYTYSPSAYNNLGIIYTRKRNYEKARECFETAIRYGNPQAVDNLKRFTKISK